ncbi:hypothetical protein NXS98_02165 [Fontisphaera persica]|uniref:hypothetical protein n=1 Tax=Fontisphaera persica TaxID=2974023 RepID=UPI0024BF7C8F|nr:hypothetical protein [Fontisphaera persica]WCJ59952.1 hypothetical protein NXS98_02165 [Fontisphaera persica]
MTPTPFSIYRAGLTSILTVVAALLLPLASASAADNAPKSPAPTAAAAPAKRNPPFVGIVQKVDTQSGTLTLNGKDGGRVFHVNAETRITKNGQPATLKEARVGEEAAGTFKDAEGRRYAVTLRLGPKPDATSPTKK